MVDFLAEEPILLLFVVVGIGAVAGTVRVRGVSLGPAAALFAGLAIGGIDEALGGSAGLGLLRELGLVLFIYTLGVASGPTFFAALRRGGLAVVGVTTALVVVLGLLTAGVAAVFDLPAADRAGVFAGAGTNTPALQAAADSLAEGNPVIGYSLAYPVAVAAMLVVLTMALGRRLPIPAALEPPPAPPPAEPPASWTILVERAGLPSLGELRERHPGLGFSRIDHDGTVSVARVDHVPVPGDALVALGPPATLAALCAAVGSRGDRHLALDRSALDFRRVLVSNRRLAGARLGDLRFADRHGVAITRLRRGDRDLVATDDTTLALGDRVRIVGPADGLARAAAELGDSERHLAEFDAFGVAVGIAVGLALGAIAVPLPGGDLRLGPGGGPLLVGLVLGARARLGPVTFQLPHGVNQTLRQLGLLMFLAAAGLGSGSTFFAAVGTRHGLEVLAAGAIVAVAFALLIPIVVEVVLRRDEVDTVGFMAGVETQPAALAFVLERVEGDERVNMAYALAMPVAMIAKILVVQFLV